ncbi:MAG TPA: cupin domain-containing protein [Polyangia bacterium]|nr:cupin domain-containing protein [Polyangia bacterium]
MRIERWDRERLGPPNEDALRKKLDALGYQVTRFVYPPGTVFETHTHEVDKIDAVVSGRFLIRMGAQSAVLEAGDAVFVPRGMPHHAEVVGEEPVVSLDALKR